MSIFSNIYNTVAKFFRPQEELGDDSKSVATNRLKLVLMQDRTNLTPRILEQMRSELIDLLSRYVELDKELLDLNFEQEGDQVALMLSIPVIRAKDEEEIEAAIKAHNESLKADNDDSEDENDDEQSDEIEGDAEDSEIDEQTEAEGVEANQEAAEKRTEEEEVEAQKTDEIAKELQTKPSVIKKKKVSAPEDISNNPFKSEGIESVETVESSTES